MIFGVFLLLTLSSGTRGRDAPGPSHPLARIWVPILFGIAVLVVADDKKPEPARWLALVGSILGLVVALPLWTRFEHVAGDAVRRDAAVDHALQHQLPPGRGRHLDAAHPAELPHDGPRGDRALGRRQGKVGQYLAAFLIMSGFINGMFAALDAIVFYVFFEAMLIPMFLIIGVWGGPNRVYAAVKFFLYTLLGSLLMLATFIYLYHATNGSFEILDWHQLRSGARRRSSSSSRCSCRSR
jgi:NADH-quinone oxidoreductase subunit M